MRIHEVMSTGVVTGTPADRVRDIVVKMLSRHCGAIPIVNANHELLGVVTLRDVMLPMYPNWEPIRHDLSTVANDLRPSASFLSPKQSGAPIAPGLQWVPIPANTPAVFPGLRPRI